MNFSLIPSLFLIPLGNSTCKSNKLNINISGYFIFFLRIGIERTDIRNELVKNLTHTVGVVCVNNFNLIYAECMIDFIFRFHISISNAIFEPKIPLFSSLCQQQLDR